MGEKLTRASQVLSEGLLREWVEERFSYHPIEEVPSTDLLRLLKPSARSKDLSEIRPKLRRDVLFFPVLDGVMLRNDQQSFYLRGDSIYPVLTALAPLFSGNNTLEEICRGLEPPCRESLIRFIKLLLEGGILRDQAREESQLPENVRHRFRNQIDFIEHLANNPLQRFEEFRQSRILLIGGISYARCAASLLRFGLKELFALTTEADEPDLSEALSVVSDLAREGIEAKLTLVGRQGADSLGLDLEDLSIAVYCTDSPSLTDMRLISRWSDELGIKVLPGFVLANQSLMGPSMEPKAGGCLVCGMFRILDDLGNHDRRNLFRKHLFSPAPAWTRPAEPMAQMLGADMAFEAFKIAIGRLRPQTEQSMLIQWTEGEDSVGATLVPNPLSACIGDCERFIQAAGFR
jgi:hypothetical protein